MFNPDDDENSYEYAPHDRSDRAAQAIYNQLNSEDSDEGQSDEFDEESHVGDALSEAEKRVEEANLFKLLISHSFFGPESARPEVLKSVTKKIRQFAIKELNTLLGINQVAPQVINSAQFSVDEVTVLKKLVAKTVSMTTGSTQAPVKPEIMPVQAPTPQLNTVAAPKSPLKQINTQPQQRQPSRPQAAKPPRKQQPNPTPPASNKRKKMPSAQQILSSGIYSNQQPVVTAEDKTSVKAINSGTSTVSNIIQSLTGGGQRVHIDQSSPMDAALESTGENVNGRF